MPHDLVESFCYKAAMVVLCVDAGTTLIKTVVYDEDGAVVHTAHRATELVSPSPGFAEQDMDQVWDAVADTLREAASTVEGDVELIAITAQGDGCWLIGADGRPTGPAVLWNDARAADVVDGWQQEGRTEQAFRINGSVGFAGLPHAILAWLAQHDPQRLERSTAALTCGGWLFKCLTGAAAIDESEAAAPWLDVLNREYSAEILDLFGIPWARRLQPELRHDDNRGSPLSAAVSERLGIPEGVPVVMAPYDIAATAIGAGAVSARQACTILGTTLCTEVVTDVVDLTGAPTGLTIPLSVGSRYLRSLPTLAGTQVLAWAADLLNVADEAELCRLAATATAGADGLMFLPYLSPAGERVPFVDSTARGTFVGLSFDHDRSLVARAVLEGLTYVIRDCLSVSGTAPSELRVCGGGAKSGEWCQVIADVLGVPVIRLKDEEVGARGAHISGLVAVGKQPDHAAAVELFVQQRDAFTPDPSQHDAYDQLFGDFLAIRDDAARSWPRLARSRRR